jgi:O-methyltransferase
MSEKIVQPENLITNPYIKNLIGTLTRTYFDEWNLDLSQEKNVFLKKIYDESGWYFDNSVDRRVGDECWPLKADTMIGIYRMINIYYLLQEVMLEKIPGDFVETGVWKGGACVLANAVLREYGEQNRRVHAFDSFEGLPKPYAEVDVKLNDKHHTFDELAVSLEEVKEVFASYGLLSDNVVFRKGWFKDTMQEVNDIESVAILRLDGDMYSSTMEVLDALYDKVPVGGYLIIDDWMLPGCRKACDDFFRKRNLDIKLTTIDKNSRFWKKTKM